MNSRSPQDMLKFSKRLCSFRAIYDDGEIVQNIMQFSLYIWLARIEVILQGVHQKAVKIFKLKPSE